MYFESFPSTPLARKMNLQDPQRRLSSNKIPFEKTKRVNRGQDGGPKRESRGSGVGTDSGRTLSSDVLHLPIPSRLPSSQDPLSTFRVRRFKWRVRRFLVSLTLHGEKQKGEGWILCFHIGNTRNFSRLRRYRYRKLIHLWVDNGKGEKTKDVAFVYYGSLTLPEGTLVARDPVPVLILPEFSPRTFHYKFYD